MGEYIDREALIQNIDEGFDKTDPCGEEQIGFLKCRRIAREIPSADVAQVRHARWEVVVGSDGKEHMVCTGCRKQQDLTGVFSYCPNCGAKMMEG